METAYDESESLPYQRALLISDLVPRATAATTQAVRSAGQGQFAGPFRIGALRINGGDAHRFAKARSAPALLCGFPLLASGYELHHSAACPCATCPGCKPQPASLPRTPTTRAQLETAVDPEAASISQGRAPEMHRTKGAPQCVASIYISLSLFPPCCWSPFHSRSRTRTNHKPTQAECFPDRNPRAGHRRRRGCKLHSHLGFAQLLVEFRDLSN